MSQNETSLDKEVKTFIADGIEAGNVIDPDWVVQEVINKYPGIAGVDADFYITCAFAHVRLSVRVALRDYKPKPDKETDPQLVLDGFEHLQKGYLVERENRQLIVPIYLCSDDELCQKVAEYRRMADGCIKHANELERYRGSRFAEAS